MSEEIDRVRREVDDLDSRLRVVEVSGTQITRERIDGALLRIAALEQEAKDSRRIIRSALITATLGFISSLLVGLALWVILGGSG